jgi:cell division protein FtsN
MASAREIAPAAGKSLFGRRAPSTAVCEWENKKISAIRIFTAQPFRAIGKENVMAKRPTDYTAQMQATEERRRLQEAKQREEAERERDLRERQAKSYGEVVLEVFERGMTIDALAGLLLDSRERLRANPELETEWTTRGEAYFRPANAPRKQLAESGATGNGHAPAGAPALPPSPARTAAPARAADLLGALAADQPGQSPAAEGGGHDGQP